MLTTKSKSFYFSKNGMACFSKCFILVFFVLLISEVHAEYYKDEIKDFMVVKVRDGDTFVINIENVPDVFGKEIAVRIRGIDTPELNDSREEIRNIAIKAKEELEKLFNSGNKIILYNLGRDKYFRLLASVKVDNIDVAEYLIKKGLAKSYDGGAKVW
ncbi:thermonuclease family protein [Brachyspira sp.]|uniref:thermonuclease family protein n=1 Tax=Brachyspira sp. TaxID=1977261 RepID=UPI003D7CFFD2